MAQSKQALKSRIRSISATKKITSAMELMATSKLKKQKDLAIQNKEYAETLKSTMDRILSSNRDLDSIYLKNREDTHPFAIIFTSDLGLCGGYNTNILKKVVEGMPKDGKLFLIGTRGHSWLENRGYTISNDIVGSDTIDFLKLCELANKALTQYKENEITSIKVYYTKFVNSVTFIPEVLQLLPSSLDSNQIEEGYMSTIYEPNPAEVLNTLIPMYVRSLLYSAWIETKTSEQASRRMAMEKATDNAEELIDHLVLVYNQARQAAITQEISEIVAGADAL